MTQTIVALDTFRLHTLVQEHVAVHGPRCDLNHIDVSRITSMPRFFAESEFNGSISRWDTRRFAYCVEMFKDSVFAGDVSNWSLDTLRASDARGMFDSPHFASRLPKIPHAVLGTMALVHQDFMGGFHPDNGLGDAARIFGSGTLLNRYLHRTAQLGEINHLHMEKAYVARRAPSDFPRELYEWVCTHKPLLLGLGLSPQEAGTQLVMLRNERSVQWETTPLPEDFDTSCCLK